MPTIARHPRTDPPPVSPTVAADICRLRDDGKTLAVIARELGLTVLVVTKVLNARTLRKCPQDLLSGSDEQPRQDGPGERRRMVRGYRREWKRWYREWRGTEVYRRAIRGFT